ncbi:MAG TPA: DinB family protein [Chitinophagales bacterium]|nr:DinB family protein [Chitinophagales bacterium]
MTTTQRNTLIESYGNAYYLLIDKLKEFPREMWQWKPAPEKWSIHEVLVHIADSEANSYIRCRRFIAEPGSGVYGYDENLWAKSLGYHNQSIEDALELFKWLRKASYELIKTVDETTWQTATINHSENGVMTFEDWLRTYEEHVPVHIRQMQRNLSAWRAARA